MARYQLLRPTPVEIYPRRFRRQAPAPSGPPAAGAEEEEDDNEAEEEEDDNDQVEEGPESPDSPGSSSDEGGGLAGDESDSESEEDEPPSPAESGAAHGPQQIGPAPTMIPGSALPSNTVAVPNNPPSNNTALPQITIAPSYTGGAQRPISSSSSSTAVPQPSPPRAGFPPGPPQSDTQAGEPPQKSAQRQDEPMVTRTTAVAATVLGVLGALALIIGLVIFMKQRKRRQNKYHLPLDGDAFNPGHTDSLRVPETAHVQDGSSMFSRIGGSGSGNGAGHLTQSSARSNTLFGPAAYERPETISTERNRSRFPVPSTIPTPNPFADPPLNKAYDVLAGRPRSTTLTDRGSWVRNPFQDPESERFDPFGQLKEKARKERIRYMEEARREAEREVVRGYEEKERMGLVPDGLPSRKGSGATMEGVGVLDRGGGGAYY